MEKTEKKDTAQLLRKGLRELAHHRPDRALETLRQAVEAIPPACTEELSHALYWLSIALLRLDKRDLAVKSLSSAQKLRHRGFARRLYLRTINQYGMPRQPNPELDDFYAFMNIQLAAYLVKKPRKRFDSFNERDAVFGILLDTWKNLKADALLDNQDCGEKLSIFKRIRPRYPDFGFAPQRTTLIKASSATNAGIAPNQRCVCGSGLPYGLCCGRVRSLGEL